MSNELPYPPTLTSSLLGSPTSSFGSTPTFYDPYHAKMLLQTQALNAKLHSENFELTKQCAELQAKNLSLQETIATLLPLKTVMESSRAMRDAWQWEKSALTLQFEELRKKTEILQDERDNLLNQVQELSNPAEVKRRIAEIDELMRKAQQSISDRKPEPIIAPPPPPTNEAEARRADRALSPRAS